MAKKSNDSSQNPGKRVGDALKDAREKADKQGKTGRRG